MNIASIWAECALSKQYQFICATDSKCTAVQSTGKKLPVLCTVIFTVIFYSVSDNF
jgi:hypothetical protein